MFDTVLGYVNENFSPLSVVVSDDDIDFKVVEVRKEPISVDGVMDERWVVSITRLEYFDDPDMVSRVGITNRATCRNWADVLRAVEMFTEGHTNYAPWVQYPESLCFAIHQTWEDDDDLYDNTTIYDGADDEDME